MFGRGGKDLDLTTPRAKTWTPTTKGSSPGNDTPRSLPDVKPTIDGPRPARLPVRRAVSVERSEGEVLARYSVAGVFQLLAGLAVLAFLLWALSSWFFQGALAPWMGFAVVLFFIFVGFGVSTLGGLFNLVCRGGRAVWIDDGLLRMIDPMGDVVQTPLSELRNIRYEHRYKRGKSHVRAIVLTLVKGRERALAVNVIDRPYGEVIGRIREAMPKANTGGA